MILRCRLRVTFKKLFVSSVERFEAKSLICFYSMSVNKYKTGENLNKNVEAGASQQLEFVPAMTV
jgi:hypothetical protein